MRANELERGIRPVLSPLESDIMSAFKGKKELKTREIYGVLKPKKKVALSSVAVLLDRLYEKGFLGRKVQTCRGGFRYLYFQEEDPQRYQESQLDGVVNKLIETYGTTAINYFNDRFSKRRNK